MSIKYSVKFVCTFIWISVCLSASVNQKMDCSEIPVQVLGEILGPAYNSRYMSIEVPPEIDLGAVQSGLKRAPSAIPSFYVDDDFSREFGDTPAWEADHFNLGNDKRFTRETHDIYAKESNTIRNKNITVNNLTVGFIPTSKSDVLKNFNQRISSDNTNFAVVTDITSKTNEGAKEKYNFEENTSRSRKKNLKKRETYELLPTMNADMPTETSKEQTTLEKNTESFIEENYDLEKRSVKAVRQWECESRIRWLDLGPDYFPRYLRSAECTSQTCWYEMLKCKPRSFTVKILRRKQDRCVPIDMQRRTGNSGLPSELRELWIWEERAVNFCCDCSTS